VRLTVVGCAGSFPGPDSAASCYLVQEQDASGRTWRVLLDLGSGAVGPLQRFATPASLDAVVLSHLHPDHCADLSGLYVALRYAPGGPHRRQLRVFGPHGTLRRLSLAYGGDADGTMDQIYDVVELDDGVGVRIGPLEVLPRLVEHPVEAYGFRVEAGGRVLAYSGDSDACESLEDLAAGADLFLCEASFQEGRDPARGVHLTGRRAGEVAAKSGTARLVLTHLPAWTDPDTVLAEAASVFSGPVAVCAAGEVYDI